MTNKRHKQDNRVAALEAKCAELEKKLQESEARFFKIFHASSNMMAITTIKDGKFVDLNNASAGLGGFKREELVGTLSAGHSLWADQKQRKMAMQKLQKEGSLNNLPVDFLGGSGELHKVLFSADPMDLNGEPCILSVSVDITAREKESETLRQSEEKYRALVENSLQGLAIIQDERYVFCNSAFSEITGYSCEELLSMPPKKMGDLTHPDDRDIVFNRYRNRLAGKTVDARYEYRGIKKDGTIIWLEAFASPMEYSGKPATQLVYMDITERKHAEEALKESREYLNQIINNIGDPLFVRDREHNFVLVNDAFCRFFHRTREEILGRTRLESLNKELQNSIWEAEEAVLRTGTENITEDKVTDFQGNSRIVMAKKSLLTDKRGNRQIIGVLRDISEYKRLEAQFLQAQKMEAIGILAGGVAHDFNNLLNVINGYSELVLNDIAPNSPIRKDIEQIKDAGQRAATLTSQLLAFGRKQIMQPEILDLNKVITRMGVMLRRLIGEDIELISITDPNLSPVNADPGKIEQLVMNLVVNARDAMPQGGKLTIETANAEFDDGYLKEHPVARKGSYVMLAVSDNGIGMDSVTLAHLFEPFYTTKEKGKGTGLGLSTVYGIVKQSDGLVWTYSELGKGTTFKIYFPRANGEAAEDAVAVKTDSGFRGSETVLVVEDEASVRSLTGRILRERGYKVLEAENGIEALRLAEEFAGNIDLVLTDAIMPGMSGKELVSRIQKLRPTIKSLFVSGYTDNSIVHHGILDANVAFLQKPFSRDGLAHKVRQVLDS
jgi:two-component system, cell cycle sensor histidine kinase and response regulator CckA